MDIVKLKRCDNCVFYFRENGHFCRADPPTATSVITQRPIPKAVAMLNGHAGGMEVNVQWISSFVPVLPEWQCGRHEAAALAAEVASRASSEIDASQPGA